VLRGARCPVRTRQIRITRNDALQHIIDGAAS
jgi:hypothetical protein